ncbi:TerB N-terminal domain-containing protein [Lentzea sp. NPDC003310]|uniref:tellurite resistance TerB family protein n=1 Tax=Lentzea sp. NPDC003310 TaxID=3154447 RepID=UPI0033B71CF4
MPPPSLLRPVEPRWVPPGETVRIGRHVLPGGMLYVGQVPSRLVGTRQRPECIDPGLPLEDRRPDHAGHGMDYWPAYHSIPPESRSGYLAWLAGGRQDPNAYIGHVFLYFYGLERRVLVDSRVDAAARADLRRIFAECLRLQRVYGHNRSFGSYVTEFLQCAQVLLMAEDPNVTVAAPDPTTTDRYPVPIELRIGLGRFARDGLPVPAEWAFSWALLHPEMYARTPAQRCPDEFRRLFLLRYRDLHGDGLQVRPLKQQVSLSYRPASSGLDDRSLTLDLPDVTTAAAPTRKLASLIEECATVLDPYSRLIGRQPEAAGSLAAAAVLPPELVQAGHEALRPTQDLVERLLGAQDIAVLDGAELMTLWPSRTPGKFVKADAVGLAQVLDRLGVGMEPDVRMGGQVLSAGPAVLFRIRHDQPTTASHEYSAATMLLHLAAVVSAADDDVSDAERDHLVRHLESALGLQAGERERLVAHLTWLLAGDTKLTGLKKRLAALTTAQRHHVADFLTLVAAIDGHVSPGEVKTLRKIYTLLELDPDSVYGRLHASAATPPPATEPVRVGTPEPAAAGFAIPPRPEAKHAQGSVVLDRRLVEARLAESAAVSALLADIFADEAEEAPPVKPPVQDGPRVGGLDSAHSALVLRLVDRAMWTRGQLEDLCEELGLMPDGALDAVNEAALEIADEPLVEGDGDELSINDYARGEMFA